ncbi:MAG: KpsF/GutQ family sugar-phosphate isomerase [Alphaproteobacteria bacterium]|nr:KpsF/GutQ family sugar-phosphate isomerase [Alphaproteobacteria bacterium]
MANTSLTPKESSSFDALESARRVLRCETEGLKALESALDANFTALVELVYNLKGRLIISGMGKSGHIARKIAATLASTGTPSYFVHPAEASHGDLGMITEGDAVMCLSNSGETAELRDIIGYTRRFSIPLIALVRRSGSVLFESADIAIVLPETPEASPTGAPTTSTLMMLAYGDALAMALLEKRGFTSSDFGVFHPGGKLGKAFIRCIDIMHRDDELPVVQAHEPMESVLITMTAKRFGCAGVLDDKGKLAGVITDGDLRRHMGETLLAAKAVDIMSKNPITVSSHQLAAEALGIMNSKSITCLFVVDAGVPVGILHVHDCLRAGVM